MSQYDLTGQSADLTALYRAYWAWLEGGATDNKPFARTTGICGAVWDMRDSDPTRLGRELRQQFQDAGYKMFQGVCVPFNVNLRAFTTEATRGRCHTNQARVSWVREHLL